MLLILCQQMTVWLNDLICQFNNKNNRQLFSVLIVSPSGNCFTCAESCCWVSWDSQTTWFDSSHTAFCHAYLAVNFVLFIFCGINSLTLFYSYFIMSNYGMLFWFVITTKIFFGKTWDVFMSRQQLMCKCNSATQSSEHEDQVVVFLIRPHSLPAKYPNV